MNQATTILTRSGTAHATEQKGEHGGEGQGAAAGEKPRGESASLHKILRIQEVSQPVYDVCIFRPSWESLN